MIQRNIEQYACTTFYLTSIYTSDVEFFTQVTAYFTAFQVQTVRPGSRYLERFAVHIEVTQAGRARQAGLLRPAAGARPPEKRAGIPGRAQPRRDAELRPQRRRQPRGGLGGG